MEAKRILVVDDDEPIRYVASQAVTKIGWKADTAADAGRALELVKINLYDAAVLDFALPDMDGVRLHSEIRRLDPELARNTLFISGVDQAHERLKYFDGVGGFLPKPFDVRELIRRLRELIAD